MIRSATLTTSAMLAALASPVDAGRSSADGPLSGRPGDSTDIISYSYTISSPKELEHVGSGPLKSDGTSELESEPLLVVTSWIANEDTQTSKDATQSEDHK